LNIITTEGCVAVALRYAEIFNNHLIANFMTKLTVKEF